MQSSTTAAAPMKEVRKKRRAEKPVDMPEHRP
jgi:hypothetical protein